MDRYIYNICIYRLDSNKIDVMLACLGFDQLLFLYTVKNRPIRFTKKSYLHYSLSLIWFDFIWFVYYIISNIQYVPVIIFSFSWLNKISSASIIHILNYKNQLQNYWIRYTIEYLQTYSFKIKYDFLLFIIIYY